MDRSNIENIYPLPPVGRALLLRCLQFAPLDPGLLHVTLRIDGPVDTAVMTRAWQQVTDRHEALRSSVHWKQSHRAMQVVHRKVDASFECRSGSPNELADFRANDWRSGVDLTTAPFDRLTLFSTSPTTHELLWTTHHLLLDGWSAVVILEELLSHYASGRAGTPPRVDPVPGRSRHASWLANQDTSAAEAFWTGYLKDYRGAHPVEHRRSSGVVSFPFPECSIKLTTDEERQIRHFVDTTECTLGQVLQTGLAVCLARIGSDTDVVFGITSSGRSPDIPFVDRMTGLFTSTLPVRIALDSSLTVRETVGKLRTDQAQLARHGFVAPDRIAELSDVNLGRVLFNHLLILENFPWKRILAVDNLGFTITDFGGSLTTTLPLSIVAVDADGLDLWVIYDPECSTGDEVARFAETLKDSLLAVAADADRPLKEILDRFPVEARQEDSRDIARASSPMAIPADLPGDATEIALARIWSDLLGIAPISRLDDFFELGGRSLQTVRLFDRIEQQFGCQLPISAIFETRTIAGMAAVIRGENTPPVWKALVPIQPFGNRPPLFCMHSFEGHVNLYQPLAERLGPDQPVYGLQAVGLDGKEPLRSIRDMADLYAREILSTQGDGPCSVLGTCLGTTIALEVAHRLVALGGNVQLYIATDVAPRIRMPEAAATQEPGQRPSETTPGSWIPTVTDLLAKKYWRTVERRVIGRYRRRREKRRIERVGTQREKWQFKVRQANIEARASYVGSPIRTPILFVQTRRNPKTWYLERFKVLALGGLDVIYVDAEHSRMFEEPEVARIAEAIAPYLDGTSKPPS